MNIKKMRFCVLLTLLFLLPPACAQPAAHTGNYEAKTITFPTSKTEMTEFNADIFAVQPFAVELSLPKGWTIQEAAVRASEGKNVFPSVDGIFCIQCILNEKGEPVGSIGYTLAPAVEAGERDPMALFAGVTLGRHHFDCKETFTPLTDTETLLTAQTDVVDDDVDGSTNFGILLRDETAGVFLAIELQSDAVTTEQASDIAKSLKIVHG